MHPLGLHHYQRPVETTHMASGTQSLRVTARGRLHEIGPLKEDSPVLELQHLLEKATHLAPSTMKLFLSGSNRGVLRLDDASGLSLSKAGKGTSSAADSCFMRTLQCHGIP